MKSMSLRSWLGLCSDPMKLYILCVSLVTTVLVRASPPNRGTHDTLDEPWLADGSFYEVDYIDDVPQADGHPVSLHLCPPVPKILPTGGCDLKECRSDRECASQGLMCCYNGCIYTCLPQVPPAAHFDWLKEPRRRFQFGSSWLVPGEDKENDVILCSTTPLDDDSDQLLCPHGYQCVIDDPGNRSKGVPNSGHCAQTVDESSKEIYNFDIQMPKKLTDLQKEANEPTRDCKVGEKSKVLSGHSVIWNGQKCLCFESKLTCEDE